MFYANIFFADVLEMFTVIIFANRLMPKKIKTPLIYALGLLSAFLMFATYFGLKSLVVNCFATTFSFFLVLFFGYKEKAFKKVIYSFYLFFLMYASEMVWTLPIYKKFDFIANLPKPQTHAVNVIITKLLFFVMAQLLTLVIKHKEFNQNKKLLPLFIFLIASISYLALLYSFVSKYNVSESLYWVLYALTIISVFASVFQFAYYQNSEEKDRKLKEIEKEQQFVELNNSYMQVLERQNNDMHMIIHDVKNHYNTIANMNDTDEIHSYVKTLSNDIQKYQIIRHTNNKMLDLLLSKYKTICNNKNISFNIEVKTANLDYIDESDLSILVCNILDNAVESAEKSKEKFINFSLRRVNSFDVLSVSNSCFNKPVVKDNGVVTNKSDKSSHGFGMKIISKYAKKNNAEYEWSFNNVSNTFTSTLVFK